LFICYWGLIVAESIRKRKQNEQKNRKTKKKTKQKEKNLEKCHQKTLKDKPNVTTTKQDKTQTKNPRNQ